MKGMRNRLVHIYFEVDLDIVWQVVNYDLPSLLVELNKVLVGLGGRKPQIWFFKVLVCTP